MAHRCFFWKTHFQNLCSFLYRQFSEVWNSYDGTYSVPGITLPKAWFDCDKWCNVYMYVLIGNGQSAQKVPTGANLEYKENFKSLLVLINSRYPGSDATVSGKRFQLLTRLHAKLYRLLQILQIWWSSVVDDLLSPPLLFSRGCSFRALNRFS